jgi:hypothetical protein
LPDNSVISIMPTVKAVGPRAAIHIPQRSSPLRHS